MSLRNGAPWIALALCMVSGSALALDPVRILSPAPDSVVRERVPIKVPADAIPNTAPTPGYVTISIDGKFEAAVARPRAGSTVTYVWDTKAPTALGQLGVSDGKHEISVTAVSQNGEPVSNTDREDVFVQNSVRSAPSSIHLRYRFTPGAQHTYVLKTLITQSDQELFKDRLVLKVTDDDILSGNVGMVRERVDRDSTESDQGQPSPVPIVGQSISFNVLPTGFVVPGRKMARLGEKSAVDLTVFPGRPVRINDTWSTPLTVSPMYQGLQGLVLPAEAVKSTLDDFEWQSGYPTAKITSKFDGTVPVVNQGTPSLYKVAGTRITYFDWRNGRVVKLLDDYTIDQTESGGGNVSLGGGPGSAPPGYPRFGPGASGPGATGTDTGSMKVHATVERVD